MRRYEVKPFETHHYMMIADDNASTFGMRGLQIDFQKIANNFANNGNYGRSGFCDGELLVCAGIMSQWPGVGVAWALISGNGRKHYHFVHRAVREGLEYFIQRLKLNRVEANVNDDLEAAKRWVEVLGFSEESVMPKYGPRGETFRKYVILR